LYRKLFTTTRRFTKGRLASAKDVVYLDKLVHKESLVNQENQADQETLAILDSLEWFLLNIVRSRPNHHAIHAHQDHLDHLALQEKMVKMVMLVKTAVQAKMVLQAQPVHQVHQAAQDNQAEMDPEVMQVEMPKDQNHNLEIKVQMAQMENQAPLVPKVNPVKMVAKAQMDPKVHQAQLVMEAQTVEPETKDHQANPANQEKRVSVQNIVPSMVESSSKMAQDDKHWIKGFFAAPRHIFLLFFSSNLRLF